MIDYNKVRSLGKLLFKLETRSKNGSKKKIAFLMLTYLLPGCFLPLLLVKQNTDPTGFEYTFLTYLFYSLIVAFTVSSELDNLVITPTETEIFTAMPIDNRILVRAKLFMLNRYVLMLSIPLFVPGAVNYYYIIKSIPRAIMYFMAGYMLCYFAINILLLIYSGAIKIFKARKLSSYTLFFQLILILIMIIGYQLVSFGIAQKQSASVVNYVHLVQKKGLIDLFPQSWYAFLPSRVQYEFGVGLFLKILLPLVICYLSYLSLRMYLEINISIIKEKITYAGFTAERSGNRRSIFSSLGALVDNLYLRNTAERASFQFMRSMFRQDKMVKLNIIPMIIIPLGLTVFALLVNQIPPPFGKAFFELRPVFHISILLSILVVINTSVLGMKLTNYPGAAWIYESYPAYAKKQFKNGIRKFYVLHLLVPLCFILSLLLSIKMPLWQAAFHAIFVFASVNLYNSLYNMISRVLPFTKENTLLNSVQKLTNMIYPFLYGSLIVLVQMFVYKSIPSSIIALLVILTLNFWLNFFAFVHVKREKAA